MIQIKNAKVYDPKNGINGEKRSLWIDGGKVVEPSATAVADKVFDVQNMVVMPGGIDMHTHPAGSCALREAPGKVSQYELSEKTAGLLPETGRRYARLGYTIVSEAAVFPSWSRQLHRVFENIPVLDKMAFLVVSTNLGVLSLLEGKKKQAKDYIAWLLNTSGAFAQKAVNPADSRGILSETEIVDGLLDINEELLLPHGLHLHCSQIGRPGNAETTCETMKMSRGRRLHLAHLQFHSYGGRCTADWCSASERICRCLEENPEVTADTGLIHFGNTVTVTADTRLSRELARLGKERLKILGCGPDGSWGEVPVSYSIGNRINSIQWITGMELILLSPNLWQLAMSTDHPNGASFTALPELLQCLVSSGFRKSILEKMGNTGRQSRLFQLDRELTLYEIAVITRAAPAKMLGLVDRGHLGKGAAGDVAVYRQKDGKVDFDSVYYLWKEGDLVIDRGKQAALPAGSVFAVRPEYDRSFIRKILAENKEPEFANAAHYGIDRSNWEKCRII